MSLHAPDPHVFRGCGASIRQEMHEQTRGSRCSDRQQQWRQSVRACRGGLQSVDELERPVPLQDTVLCAPHAAAAGRRAAAQPPPRSRCHRDAGFQRSSASVTRVALFHYATKSEQDFVVKVQRGSAMKKTGKPWSFFHQVQRCASAAVCCHARCQNCTHTAPV